MAEYSRRCDEAGLEGYLETIRWADPLERAQERLYERHGFVVAEVVRMADDWSMVTMKRPAGARWERESESGKAAEGIGNRSPMIRTT